MYLVHTHKKEQPYEEIRYTVGTLIYGYQQDRWYLLLQTANMKYVKAYSEASSKMPNAINDSRL